MIAIYKRELKSYFDSMIGYIFIAFLVAFIGIYFMVYNLSGGYPYFSYALSSVTFTFLIAIPILTMKSLAEERKSKTDQLLFTAPISISKIVIGKYLAMATVLLIPILIVCVCPLIIKTNGAAYLVEDYSAIFAFFLMGCVYIAVGMFISSFTESQIISAVSTFGILLVLYLWDGLISFLPTTAKGSLWGFLLIVTIISGILYSIMRNWIISFVVEIIGIGGFLIVYFIHSSWFDNSLTKVLSNITISEVFHNFVGYHLFDVSGLIYYISLIFVFVFLTIQSIQKRRWS